MYHRPCPVTRVTDDSTTSILALLQDQTELLLKGDTPVQRCVQQDHGNRVPVHMVNKITLQKQVYNPIQEKYRLPSAQLTICTISKVTEA